MPPQSRGRRLGSYSLSTPDLPTLKSLRPLDTSLATGLQDVITSARSLQVQRPTPLNTENERFPDLDGGGEEQEEDDVLRDLQAPRPTNGRGIRSPFLENENYPESDSDGEEEIEEEEASDDDTEEGNEGSSGQPSVAHGSDRSSRTGSEDEDSSSDTSSQDEASSDPVTPSEQSDPTIPSHAPVSAPSTLHASRSHIARLPSPATSSTDSSPQKDLPRPPGPNRSQSLYTQPSYTKSHSAIHSLHSSISRTNLNPAAFAPPFYNRPPTPLPPSPSLTSLLRPLPFPALPSRPSSRPRTPGNRTPVDSSSDTEFHPPHTTAEHSTAGHSTTSLPPTAPPVAPKIPTYEYYGFTLYATSLLAGIYYYPNRWWALAIPAWLVMLLIWIFVALGAYNTGTLTLGVSSVSCLVDEKGRVAALGADGSIELGRHSNAVNLRAGRGNRERNGSLDQSRNQKRQKKTQTHSREKSKGETGTRVGRRRRREMDVDWKGLWSHGTDGVLDVPIGGVCEVLYGDAREES
ncbi:MAG: hypothetical protein Q9162_001294 [Coniocarpon cinnabarinum]